MRFVERFRDGDACLLISSLINLRSPTTTR